MKIMTNKGNRVRGICHNLFKMAGIGTQCVQNIELPFALSRALCRVTMGSKEISVITSKIK